MCRALLGDKLQRFVVGFVAAQRRHQYARNLCACDCAVFGTCVTMRVTLQEYESLLVGIVVVEPAGAHDGVFVAAGAHQTFGTSFPVVRLIITVVFRIHVGHADRRHQGDAHLTPIQGEQGIAHRAVIDLFDHRRTVVRTHGEYDAIDAVQCAFQ